MRYATWKLDFTNPKYGTGPEPEIARQGGYAEGAFPSIDSVEAIILGYFEGDVENLEGWEFTEVTADEALAFVMELNDTAYFLDDGRIAFNNPPLN